jgi:hypothetical protein
MFYRAAKESNPYQNPHNVYKFWYPLNLEET